MSGRLATNESGVWECVSARVDPDAQVEQRFFGLRTNGVWRAMRGRAPVATVFQLLLLNLALQVADGLVTYTGLRVGLREANPLLCKSFALWGVGPTLVLYKSLACVLLLVLYCLPARPLVARAFRILAVLSCVCTLIPWVALFVALCAGWL